MINPLQYENAKAHLNSPACHNWTKKVRAYIKSLELDPVDESHGLELLAKMSEYECLEHLRTIENQQRKLHQN